jgi:TctA family transporter
MLMSDGKWSIYAMRPICLLLLAGIVVLLALPIVKGFTQTIAAPKPSAERN